MAVTGAGINGPSLGEILKGRKSIWEFRISDYSFVMIMIIEVIDKRNPIEKVSLVRK